MSRDFGFGAHVLSLLAGASATMGGAVALSPWVFGAGGALVFSSGVFAYVSGKSVAPGRWRLTAEITQSQTSDEDVERALAKLVGSTAMFFGTAILAIATYAAVVS